MRWAKSYSIIDHQILHGGYLHRLSHEAMILYLFLATVGDGNGRSFYSDSSIMGILRLDDVQINEARKQLLTEGLIGYYKPFWQVKNIIGGSHAGRKQTKDILSAGRNEDEFLSDRGDDRDFAKNCLKDISRILSGQQAK